MTVIATPRNFHTKFKFLVEIDGFGSAAFQACSELAVEAAEITYYEGGAIVPDKQPGRLTFTDITLDRGATSDKDMFEWMKQVGDAAKNAGRRNPDYKRNLDIVQLERDGTVLRRWRVEGAWPKKFVGGAWDNNSDENAMEQIVLAIDSFDLVANNG